MSPEMLFTSVWSNNAKIEVFYYKEPLEGESESDRIQLVITPADGKPRGWIMNIQDATDIIYGLSKAMSRSIEDNVPNYHQSIEKGK